MKKKCILIIVIVQIAFANLLNAQITNNLIINGSFNGSLGENKFAEGWKGNGTPDINDFFSSENSGGNLHWQYKPNSSNDGGTWQSLLGISESVEQTVNVTLGEIYSLQFEFSSYQNSLDNPTFKKAGGFNIFINGVKKFTTQIDTTPYSWEKVCYTFKASTPTITIKFCPSENQYIALDGVSLTKGKWINFGNDTLICEGDMITLIPQGTEKQYLWQDNTIALDYKVGKAGKYWASVVWDNCIVTDTINVKSRNCNYVCDMPSILTPNNDGKDDFFIPVLMKGIKSAKITIYNRWGQKMFESENLNNGWDGTFEGKECPAGTYYYTLKYTTTNGESKENTAFFNLIR